MGLIEYMPKEIKEYEQACQKIAEAFTKKYFKDPESWCVADNPTDVWYVNDIWLNVDEMYQYLKYKYSQKKMLERYYKKLEHYQKYNTTENFPNIKNYKYAKRNK